MPGWYFNFATGSFSLAILPYNIIPNILYAWYCVRVEPYFRKSVYSLQRSRGGGIQIKRWDQQKMITSKGFRKETRWQMTMPSTLRNDFPHDHVSTAWTRRCQQQQFWLIDWCLSSTLGPQLELLAALVYAMTLICFWCWSGSIPGVS